MYLILENSIPPYTGILITVAVGLLIGVVGADIPTPPAARMRIVEALHNE